MHKRAASMMCENVFIQNEQPRTTEKRTAYNFDLEYIYIYPPVALFAVENLFIYDGFPTAALHDARSDWWFDARCDWSISIRFRHKQRALLTTLHQQCCETCVQRACNFGM